jgi:hypothetical protein
MNRLEDAYPDIYQQKPALLSMRALRVFPPLSSQISRNVFLANTACNLAGYYLDSLLYFYHPSGDFPEIDSYLVDFSVFLRDEKIQQPVANWYLNTSDDIGEPNRFIEKMKKFPVPPDNIHAMLKEIYHFLNKALQLTDIPESSFAASLYDLSVSWMDIHQKEFMHLVPAHEVLKTAEILLKQLEQKQYNYHYLWHEWGKEYDEYYREFLGQELSDKTARKKARQKFIENHPMPEGISESGYPGTSVNSVKKYQKIYLNWRKNYECQDHHESLNYSEMGT